MADSIGDCDTTVGGRTRTPAAFRWPGISRRGVQVGLGVLWLLDGALQLQPFMFTADFARKVIAPAAQGQPTWLAAPLDFFVRLIVAHPAPLNTGFALVQLALGVGFLLPRLVRPAIVASMAWSAAVWFSEGLGGLATGTASLVTGAPGAVLLYAVLASAAWPASEGSHEADPAAPRIAGWFPVAWATLWIGGALLQILPSQRGTAAMVDQIGNTDGVPGWLGSLHQTTGAALSHAGTAPYIVLVTFMVLIGLAGLADKPWRTAAAVVGSVVAIAFWVLGQNIGGLYSGQATDPNTGPLIVLMALALVGTLRSRRVRVQASRLHRLSPTPHVS